MRYFLSGIILLVSAITFLSTFVQSVEFVKHDAAENELEALSKVNHKTRNTKSLEKEKKKNKKGKKKNKKGKKKNKKNKSNKKGKPDYECGVDYCNTKPQLFGGLKGCLKGNFDHGSSVFFPSDGGLYWKAKQTWMGSRQPAAVVYVENDEDVQKALKCTVENGYRASARGKGHSYQGLSAMDGYVVIDMSRTCKPDEFVINHDDQGPHLLEGSKYIGTIKAQSGCTNTIMLAHTNKHFREEEGIVLIGSCPSVGITGFVLGGGGGDVSPYVGYGVDIVKEFQIVLYDGTIVTASEEENEDLYWASRGGGGGNGIITHLTYKIVQAPKPKKKNQGNKYTYFGFVVRSSSAMNIAAFMNHFFYEVDPTISGKFGGSGAVFPSQLSFVFVGIYLGSREELIVDMKDAGFFDTQDIFVTSLPDQEARFTDNYETVCKGSDCEYQIIADQFDTYAEAQTKQICINDHPWTPHSTGGTLNKCADLGIDDDNCELSFYYNNTVPTWKPKECSKVVIDAMLEKAEDPGSFINTPGPSQGYFDWFASYLNGTLEEKYELFNELFVYQTLPGGVMIPRTSDITLAKIFSELQDHSKLSVQHYQHAAPLVLDKDDTAYPWRDSFWMLEETPDQKGVLADLQNLLMREEGVSLQGYYAYLGPPSRQNWRSFYFGDNYKALSHIRAKYDPLDIFGKPLTVESIPE